MIELDSANLFAGRYRVVRRLAAGGMGAVFEVIHVETDRHRALKVMLPELVAQRELRDRFQMEARVTARVHSEHIVDVFDAGVDATTGMPFLVMELLHGEELGTLLDREGALETSRALTYLRQIANTLDKTHAAGIVHRDLKPGNLFLTHREDGSPRIKILDFGISKIVNEASAGFTRSLGTPYYMAPEQALGQKVTAATDTYALGMIAYTLLVGVSYWREDVSKFENAIAFVLHASRGVPESAVARAARAGCTLPPAFDAWFVRATNLNPVARYQRASELLEELAKVFGPEAAAATVPPRSMSASQSVQAPRGFSEGSARFDATPSAAIDRTRTFAPHVYGARKRPSVLVAAGALGVIGIGAVGLIVWTLRDKASTRADAPATASSGAAQVASLGSNATLSSAIVSSAVTPETSLPSAGASATLAPPRVELLPTPPRNDSKTSPPPKKQAPNPAPALVVVPSARPVPATAVPPVARTASPAKTSAAPTPNRSSPRPSLYTRD